VKGILLRVTLVVLLVGVMASTADAQRRARRRSAITPGPRYGAHLGYNFDADALLIGAQVSWPVSPRLDIYPSFDYYFVDPGSAWALNFDLKFRPPTRYGAWYLGGGLDLFHSGGSDTNLDLFTGIEARRGRTRPYAEARFILGNGSTFQIAGGFSVP
jgi:hypothetical protein